MFNRKMSLFSVILTLAISAPMMAMDGSSSLNTARVMLKKADLIFARSRDNYIQNTKTLISHVQTLVPNIVTNKSQVKNEVLANLRNASAQIDQLVGQEGRAANHNAYINAKQYINNAQRGLDSLCTKDKSCSIQ